MLEKHFSASAIAKTLILAATVCAFSVPAFSAGADAPMQLALSEIKKEELPKAAEPAKPGAEQKPAGETQTKPSSPEKPVAAPEQPAQAPAATDDDGDAAQSNNPAMPNAKEGAPTPQVEYDFAKLPFPVQKMRELILTAAKSGSIEALRPLIGSGDDVTMLSLTDIDGDPLAYLKSLAGDPDGQEILAILVDVLESGYVHLDAGTADELYVWPYFFAYPLDKLDAKQKVELFQIVTAGDYDEMKQFGTYVFYRLGITPKGRWRFFVTGD
jgi:flagellar motor protein MotB